MDRFVVSRLELSPRCDCATDFVCVDLSGGVQATSVGDCRWNGVAMERDR